MRNGVTVPPRIAAPPERIRNSIQSENSRRLELSISKKHPARKVGTRSRQCRPKVCLSRCPKSYNLKHFTIRGKFSSNFPGIFLELSCRTPAKTPETSTAFSSFLIQRRVFIRAEKGHKNQENADLPEPPKPRKIQSHLKVTKK